MAPDGTVVFPTFVFDGSNNRAAVQIRPAGGPLDTVELLSPAGVNAGGTSVDAGGDGRFVAAWVESGDIKVATLMPGAADFVPTLTLSDDTAEGASVEVDGAGNAFVIWNTRDDVNPGLQRQVRVRITTIPADGSTPTTDLNETFVTPSGVGPSLGISFDVNDAGDAVFVKSRGTFDTATNTTTLDYEGWTRPAGGSNTTVTPLASSSYTGNIDANGESQVSSLNVDINEAGQVMASWYKYSFTALDSIDVVNGTAASGFGAISNPTLGGHLARTTVTSVLDASGRTTVAGLMEESGTNKLRSRIYTRSPAGVWAGPQSPLPTGDHNYGNELAADPDGRVMLVFQKSAATSTIYTAIAEPGQLFDTPQLLASGLAGLQRAIPAFGSSGDGVVAWVFDENTAQVTDAAGYDASPPQMRNLVLPTAGTAGTALDFSVQPFDIWSDVTTSWNFDGVTSDGATQSHVFGDAGDKAVSVTATDALGNSSSSNGTVSIAAAPVQPVDNPPIVVPDTTKPTLSAVAFSPATFAVGKKATPLIAKLVRGSRLNYTLSEAAAVSIKVQRELPGLKSGKRCIAPKKGKKVAKRKRCTRLKTMGTFKRTGVAGANKMAFSGRIAKRALGVGRYRATLVATDAAGNKSAPVTAKFRIAPVPQRPRRASHA